MVYKQLLPNLIKSLYKSIQHAVLLIYSSFTALFKQKKLWIGTPINKSLTIYHGVSNSNTDEYQALGIISTIFANRIEHQAIALAISWAIFKTKAISPREYRSLDHRDIFSSLRFLAFQAYIAELSPDDYKKNVNLKDFTIARIEHFYKLLDACTYSLKIIKSLIENDYINLDFAIDEMTATGRNLTNWFSTEISEKYGEFISFKFDLTTAQIKELNKTNAGGNFFYATGRNVICHQPLSLLYCREIIVNSSIETDIWDNLLNLIAKYNKENNTQIKLTLKPSSKICENQIQESQTPKNWSSLKSIVTMLWPIKVSQTFSQQTDNGRRHMIKLH